MPTTRTPTRTRNIFSASNLRTFLFTILLILNNERNGNVNAQTPTPLPTPLPTKSPTASPTASPTPSPTTASPSPSYLPTALPSFTTNPSARPSTNPSASPVASPVAAPVAQLQSFTERSITITLTGVLPLDDKETAYFENRTEYYIEYYFDPSVGDDPNDTGGGGVGGTGRRNRILRELQSSEDVYDVTVSINVTSMDPPYMQDDASRSRFLNGILKSKGTPRTGTRNLQSVSTSVLRITYDQSMSYRYTGKNGPNAEDLILEPFSTLTRRKEYINFLQASVLSPSAAAFSELDKVSPPELVPEKEKVSIVAIIACAAGAVAFLVLVAIFVIWRRRRKSGREEIHDMAEYDPRRRTNGVERSNHIVPSDGGSTLMEPSQQGVYTTQQSVAGGRYGPGSIATDDPDYQYHHAYEDPTIVSNTDGTLGDATRQSTQIPGGGESVLGPGGAQSVFSDDQSFEAFRNRDGRREEVLEIYAPAGKLGVVIDTPDTGAPVLHRIKDTCPIADLLQVGDKLIAVDDEDVRSMTAVRVSKLISQKSGNPQRKFTIVRSV